MGVLKRLWAAFDDRTGLSKVIGPIMRHPVPPANGAVGWIYVFGSATLFSFVVAVISGIPLALEYIASTGEAYQSLQWITHGALLGNVVRGMHWYAANAMMVLVGLHTLRVFLTGAFKFPRELNWISGVVLLLLTLGLTFTGQILRWDAFGVWTIMIIAAQADRVPLIGNWLAHFLVGGQSINGITLSRFFALHVFVLPALLLAIVGFHLYMVVHTGISEPPARGRPVDKTYRVWYKTMLDRIGVPFWPDAAWRDVVFSTIVMIGIIAFTIWIGAPDLAGPPEPAQVNVFPQPDWYFLWYFGALAMLPASLEDWVIIGGPLLFFGLLFVLPLFANKGERSPLRRPWSVGVAGMALVILISLTVSGQTAGWSPRFSSPALPASVIGAPPGSSISRGAALFHQKGCGYCHAISGQGGLRGPDLTDVGSRLTASQITIRILNGGVNMPAYGVVLTQPQIDDLVAFLTSRKGNAFVGSGSGHASSRPMQSATLRMHPGHGRHRGRFLHVSRQHIRPPVALLHPGRCVMIVGHAAASPPGHGHMPHRSVLGTAPVAGCDPAP